MSALSTEAGLLNLLDGIRGTLTSTSTSTSTLLLKHDDVTMKGKGKDDVKTKNDRVTSSTDKPEFSDPDTTDNSDPAVKYEYDNGLSKKINTILNNLQKLSDDETQKLFAYLSTDGGICVCCRRPTDNHGGEDVQS